MKTKPAYYIFDTKQINDTIKFEKYLNQVPEIVKKFGGEYLALGGQMELIEGNWKPTTIVIIKFPDFKSAKNWYNSSEYHDLKNLRLSSGVFDGVVVEGL